MDSEEPRPCAAAERPMRSGDGSEDHEERIPRLSAAWEWQAATLTPAEGYVLSRIDGRTPWTALRQIGGIAPADVDGILERWAKEGWIEVQAVEVPQCPAKTSPDVATPDASPRKLTGRALTHALAAEILASAAAASP